MTLKTDDEKLEEINKFLDDIMKMDPRVINYIDWNKVKKQVRQIKYRNMKPWTRIFYFLTGGL